MGRSVSYPLGAEVAYAATPYDENWCFACGESESECECADEERDIQEREVDWLCVKDDLIYRAKSLFPSLYEPTRDIWRGREDHVLLRNRLVDFGVSEYCGLMAIWIVPREGLDGNLEAFAARWIASISEKFQADFGEFYRVGGFCDGTSIYQRRQPEKGAA